jgi:4'-phosphopantetheinyl transferase
MLAAEPGELVFARRPCPTCGGATGRPFLRTDPSVQFSLAHTRGLVAVAVADVPVGIDVERSDRTVGSPLVRALHSGEQRELGRLQGSERHRAALRCWVRKEAALKATGQGVAHGVERPYVGTGRVPASTSACVVRDLDPAGGFLAAAATVDAARLRTHWSSAFPTW